MYVNNQVIYAARHEWALRADDIIARRTRLAFLNKEAAIIAIPTVIELMALELKWSYEKQYEETSRCVEYMMHFGGPKPLQRSVGARVATMDDIREAFRKVDYKQEGLLDPIRIELVALLLNRTLSDEEIFDCFSKSNPDINLNSDLFFTTPNKVLISMDQFAEWWNSESCNPELSLLQSKKAVADDLEGSGALFG